MLLNSIECVGAFSKALTKPSDDILRQVQGPVARLLSPLDRLTAQFRASPVVEPLRKLAAFDKPAEGPPLASEGMRQLALAALGLRNRPLAPQQGQRRQRFSRRRTRAWPQWERIAPSDRTRPSSARRRTLPRRIVVNVGPAPQAAIEPQPQPPSKKHAGGAPRKYDHQKIRDAHAELRPEDKSDEKTLRAAMGKKLGCDPGPSIETIHRALRETDKPQN